jgi:hypothetical protein
VRNEGEGNVLVEMVEVAWCLDTAEEGEEESTLAGGNGEAGRGRGAIGMWAGSTSGGKVKRVSAIDMEPAQDPEIIESLYQISDMGKRPGWFRMSRA